MSVNETFNLDIWHTGSLDTFTSCSKVKVKRSKFKDTENVAQVVVVRSLQKSATVAKYCNKHVCVCVCVSVCPREAISRTAFTRRRSWINFTCNRYNSRLYNNKNSILLRDFTIVCACCLWPWLGPPPAVWRNPKGKGQSGGFVPHWQRIVQQSIWNSRENSSTDQDAVWVDDSGGP